MNLSFFKYQGTGNDFVLIDNRNAATSLTQKQVAFLCDRRFGIGADGLMELQMADGFDFKMVYYNADGKEGSMCGNGGRCITRFAFDCGIVRDVYEFIAVDGPHKAFIDSVNIIHLKMKDVWKIEDHDSYLYLNTGSPHVVRAVKNLKEFDVVTEGKAIRYGSKFHEEGVNVNFVEKIDIDHIYVRTYERGVENETFSCGTGVTAAALVNACNPKGFNHINVQTTGGNLFIEFDKTGVSNFENIWLCGPAKKVFEGTIDI